ncbi:hypothetical protein RHGRI_008415 [Rhododendron griersonianum]|uniref:BHLH domain-containing protein n=1 Tax=Rhododendron griersonianum TaxID=479676 RepID=A0AAV6L1R5_9ERIC|nr:hypothetical protein RHGRI_008415 [Rhododendron griersonianum]
MFQINFAPFREDEIEQDLVMGNAVVESSNLAAPNNVGKRGKRQQNLPAAQPAGDNDGSDQMHEAVNYINHLKNNVKELEIKRDNLKKLSDSGSGLRSSTNNINGLQSSSVTVTVNQCSGGGVEVLIGSCGFAEEGGLPLSKVLGVLVEQGLDVVSYISSDEERQGILASNLGENQRSQTLTAVSLSLPLSHQPYPPPLIASTIKKAFPLIRKKKKASIEYCISNMFTLQHGDELVFQISKIEQDLISTRASLDSTHLTSTPPAGKKKRKKSYSNQQEDKYENNNEKKMIAHRDVERQRRQEMAKLYASLRSLLPAEYVKGKRSVCDHMNESVNYIKQLQENIEQLSMKRDNLKNMSDSVGNNTEATGSSENCFPGRVMVGLCWGGVEILISTSTGSEDEGFPMSRVLEILVEEGLDVVSCVSTQINKKLLHVIKSEVSDPTCVDLSMLEEKLADVINGN